MTTRSYLRLIVLSLLLSSCATVSYKDLPYDATPAADTPKLNVFVPHHPQTGKRPLLLFIHGGNWNSGNKGTYGLLGRNFAKKGVVTVIPDYTLSPKANYDTQAAQVAAAIRWAKTHAAEYGADPDHIYVSGHSAGGHLAALAVMNPKYGIAPGTVAGIILNDAAGLDMQHYLEQNPPTTQQDYLATWTNDPANWHEASPIYYLNRDTPPFLIYVGDKTYASIKETNERFLAALHPFQPNVVPIRVNKSHIPMVLQYFWPHSKRFDEILAFIHDAK